VDQDPAAPGLVKAEHQEVKDRDRKSHKRDKPGEEAKKPRRRSSPSEGRRGKRREERGGCKRERTPPREDRSLSRKEKKRRFEKPREPAEPPRGHRDWGPRELGHPTPIRLVAGTHPLLRSPPGGQRGRTKGPQNEPNKKCSTGPKRAGVIRKPASRRVMRRPAGELSEEKEEKKEGEGVRNFSEMKTQDLLKLGDLCLQEAIYYGRTVLLAGRVVALKTQNDQIFADFRVSGTKDDGLLRILSGRADKVIQVHLCDPGCGQLLTDELLVHSPTFEKVDLALAYKLEGGRRGDGSCCG